MVTSSFEVFSVGRIFMTDDESPFEVLREIVYENTYITTPEGHGEEHVCRRHKIQQVTQSLLQTRVSGLRQKNAFSERSFWQDNLTILSKGLKLRSNWRRTSKSKSKRLDMIVIN